MSHLLAAANLDNTNSYPHSPEFKPTESPLNDIMELSLPESQISNDSNTRIDVEEQQNIDESSLPKRKLTIYEFLECKRSNSF